MKTKKISTTIAATNSIYTKMQTIRIWILFLCMICILECRALPRPQDSNESFRRTFAIQDGAPLITPLQEDVILDIDSRYLLRCEANDTIEWKTPHVNLPYEVETFDTLDAGRPYGSVLHLTDINVRDVGYYYCIRKSDLVTSLEMITDEELSEMVNNNQASNIYIYVNDADNLLVPIDYSVGYAHQYADVTIPCKPSIPSTEVLLTTPNDQTFSSDSTGRYDPKRGFVVEIRGLTDTGTFICRPKIPSPVNEEEETQIDILFDGNEHMDQKLKLKKQLQTNWNTSFTPYALEVLKKFTRKTTIFSRTTTTTTTTTESTLQDDIDIDIDMSTEFAESTVTNQMNVTNSTVNHMNAGEIVANYVMPTVIQHNRLNVNQIDVAGNNTRKRDLGGDNNNYNTNNGGDGINKHTVIDVNHQYKTYSNIDISDELSGVHLLSNDIENVTAGVLVTTVSIIIYENRNTIGAAATNSEQLGVGDNSLNVNFDGMGADDNDAAVAMHRLSRRALTSVNASPNTSYPNITSARRPKTTFINKPVISSESNGHVYEGDTFQLKCEVTIAHDVRYVTDWITPEGVDPSRIEKGEATFKNHTPTHRVGSAVLTVKNAMKSDEGKYKCHVVDQSKNKAQTTYTMTILKKGETYLNVSEPNGYYKINARANNTVQMTVKYRGYPMPVLEWYKSDGNSNSNGTKITNLAHKYDVNTTAVSSTLKIIKAQMTDTGEYLLFANNGVNFERLEFQVTINDTPIVSVKDEYVQVGGEAHVTCKVLSHPKAVVTWFYTPCTISPRWPSCERNLEQFYNNTRNVRMGESSIEYLYDMYFSPTKPGIMHCVAINAEGKTMGKGHVLIGDISSNMTVYGVDDNRKIARGDEVTITCAALAYFFSDELVWYKDGVEVEQSDDIVIISDTSDYSYKRTLIFRNIQETHQGTYECRARHINYDKQDNKYINIFVFEPKAPTIVSSNMNSNKKIELKLGEPLKLECRSEAIPRANVIWYKDDVELNHNHHVIIEDDNTQLLVKFMRPEDEGTYKCFVSNRMGSVEASTAVKITNLPGMQLGWILGLVFFFVFLLGIVCYLSIRVKRGRKLLRELKAAGLANFEEGAVEHINPALTLDEQADLLPYDRNFEFPREKLKLGKQLGAGAFGVVLKAHAEGIKPEERETVVAVKMVKRTADNEVMRALVSELKIMVHLGQHLNVVNLLGAVTKNIAKRELMVIVEFCRFGNVQNFLLRNRKRFIDQINPDTDKIDPTILTQRFSDNFEMNRNSDNDPRSGTRAGRPNSRGYLRQSDLYEGHVDSCATEQTVMTTVPEDEDIMSNNSIQPAWRSNYKSDSTEAMTVTTSDLVSWAFQVARGMDYLSSKKVLHGDLAARNILLCEDNVVKICDFGLARSMYKGDNYKKQGEAPLPIKWLALESLSDHIFSTYTDVWSFGIVLWEFFSLAKVPYPGMDPNQNLYLKLKDGYRMDKPVFANDELYDIMLECWSTNPESRPLFHELEKKFARMLGDEVTSHYVDLNDPYMRCNSEYMKNSKTDYLALMGSPDEMAPPPPRYVNGLILPEIRIDSSSDDYMQMSANPGTIIFSPTRPKDYESSNDDANNSTNATSFTFPDTVPPPHSPTLANNLDSPVNKTRKKDGVDVQPEEIPMLHQQHNSDGEPSPDQSRKFANILQQTRSTPTPSPRHHVIETKLSGEDDYVNVKSPSQSQPQSQTQSPNKALNNNGERKVDAFSNPSYQMLKTVTETGK